MVAAQWPIGGSSSIGLRNRPTPSISTSHTSPGFIQSWGRRGKGFAPALDQAEQVGGQVWGGLGEIYHLLPQPHSDSRPAVAFKRDDPHEKSVRSPWEFFF